jgi:hypothetical protein
VRIQLKLISLLKIYTSEVVNMVADDREVSEKRRVREKSKCTSQIPVESFRASKKKQEKVPKIGAKVTESEREQKERERELEHVQDQIV